MPEQLLSALGGSARKRFRSGTHRSIPPEKTVERVSRLNPALGITRVANVTGLDRIGIPVTMVCRPNSRSLAVSQGKGLTLAAAQASGLMESLELFHAERITAPLKLASHNELRFTHRVVDVTAVPRPRSGSFHDDLRMLWIEAVDLLSGEPTWMPFELAHMDCTRPVPPGTGAFQLTSNGLASGNHIWEATVHAICEVVERDAVATFHALDPAVQAARRVRLDSIDDPDCCRLLELFDRAKLDVAVWDLTTDTGIPCFESAVIERAQEAADRAGAYHGAGCHPTRGIALSRALTESAQVRLTVIAGSRDDLNRALYEKNPERVERERREVSGASPRRRFSNVPSWESDDLEEDGRWLLDRLEAAGFTSVLLVDLTLEEIGVPVVRAVIPGAKGVGGLAPTIANTHA